MKTSVKVLVAAAIAAACSGPAMAYGPTVAPDFSFFVGGGSAQGGAFLAFAQSLMSADGNLDVYTDDAAACGQGANYRAVFGTWKTTTGGIAAGKKVFIAYANNGGTFKNGIDGVARAHNIDYAKFLGTGASAHVAACTAALGAGVPSPFTATAQYAVSTTATENHIPDAGLSDEEMGLFVGVNLPTTAPNAPLTGADFTNTTRTPLYQNVFGVAINTRLSAALTTAFGNQTITSAQVAAILAGTYTDWSQVCQINASSAQVCLPGGPITFISRSPGSGSKAAFNEYFLNNPGTTGFAGSSVPPVDQTGNQGDCTNFSAGSYNICDQSSNGNVKKALNTANTKNTRALGILGLEFQPVATDAFTFANLDGVDIQGTTTKTCGNAFANAFEPARVVNGDHKLYYTNSLNIRSKNVAGAHFQGDGSVNSAFMGAFSTAAANPVLEVSVPGVLLDPAVVGGPGGFPYDDCITKGTHNGDSTGPLVNQF